VYNLARRVPPEKCLLKPYNKSFIDQAFSVKLADYWPNVFCKKKLGQYSAILSEQLVNNPLFLTRKMGIKTCKHAKKELVRYPAIFTSHLINNPYIQREKVKMEKLRKLKSLQRADKTPTTAKWLPQTLKLIEAS